MRISPPSTSCVIDRSSRLFFFFSFFLLARRETIVSGNWHIVGEREGLLSIVRYVSPRAKSTRLWRHAISLHYSANISRARPSPSALKTFGLFFMLFTCFINRRHDVYNVVKPLVRNGGDTNEAKNVGSPLLETIIPIQKPLLDESLSK